MSYSIGSVADLISGKDTPNKTKIIKKEYVKPMLDKSKGSANCDSGGNDFPKRDLKKRTRKKNYVSTDPATEESRSATEESPVKKTRDKGQENRTIFVGNVPLEVSKIKLKKLFGKFGEIESIRLRCAAPDDPKVTKKIAVIKKRFHPDRKSLHSFIRFQARDHALKALELNGFKYKNHHLRVNMAENDERRDENKAIFVGNIPFEAEEEDLWKLFESCGEIFSVRLVRDPRTAIGKGFGYVNFKSSDAVELALEMGEFKLKNRELRVKRCNVAASKNTKAKKKKPKWRSLNPKGGENGNDNENEEDKPKKLKSVAVKKSIFQGVTAAKKMKKKIDKTSVRKKLIGKLLTSKAKKPKEDEKAKSKREEKDPYSLKIFY